LFSLLLRCAPAFEDELTGELWEAGTTGIVDEPGGLRAFFEESADQWLLLRQFAAYAPLLRREQAVDWEQVSRDAWPPLQIGERFFLVAPWRDDPTPGGRLRLEMTPGMACGTGHHPATQLCLEAMERYVHAGATVLDVGAGSGILSAAAQLLGARLVVACDIDAEAIAIARERLTCPVFAGSADAVRSGFADVIVANISSAAVEELAAEFRRVQKPGGVLILSGFPGWDSPEGYDPKETLQHEGWNCLVC
jgi:ribosomal protein L11 methyltransferase